MAVSKAARIREQLGHPIIDGDGHWTESQPVFVEYVREIGGPKLADEYLERCKKADAWYQASPEERMRRRMVRPPYWVTPGNTRDMATSLLPALMLERLDEFGIDFAIIYPTLNLATSRVTPEDLRRAMCRAYNKMAADIYAPFKHRFAPAAIIPAYTPEEGIEELEYAAELGLKVAMFRGSLPRPIPAYAKDGSDSVDGVPYYVDAYGVDNPHDFDPLWQHFVDLGFAVTAHQGSPGWADRRSVTNNVFNHLGHVANANHAFTKSAFLGGLVRRFPSLNFAFLEGGVGYGVSLLCDLIGHWEKRNVAAMEKNLRPTNLDQAELARCIEQYGYDAVRGRAEEIVASLEIEEMSAREREHVDDFEHIGIGSKQELVDLYSRNFYFGCEADDPATAWAYDPRMPGRLKAMFSSDVSHWDVPDMAEVLVEAYEMVEHGLLTEADFREFTYSNALHLHGDMNPDFFKGTVLEKQAEQELRAPAQLGTRS
ncbi:MAG TPA: amidohydrolase family protein [Chloroflexota bacterium]|nr:amidohydrolase family protein [Chloroflexota bacterium]